MVCYARPAGRIAAIVLVVFLVSGRWASHFFDAAALMAAVAVAAGGTAVAAALAFAAFLSARRRRAAAGGCLRCQYRCQHDMAAPPGLRLMSTTGRRQDTQADRAGPARPPAARPTEPAGPRWPDRPLHGTGPATGRTPRPAGHAERRQRLGSAV